MQITSVRYRELVSLRGCEHKALEATVGLGEPPSPSQWLRSYLMCAAVLSLEEIWPLETLRLVSRATSR